ncbi:PHD-type domain-containing protein, partial [Haematococcus lacustris]
MNAEIWVEELLAAGPGALALDSLTVESDGNAAPFNAPASVFDSQAHCLHGVLHANGYGHLNGGPLDGRRVVGLWDSLCRLLGAREVSVEDVSNKEGMLLRLLHTAAFGRTWYGKWGYQFGRAPYNIQAAHYKAAVQAVRDAPLVDLLMDFQAVDPQ